MCTFNERIPLIPSYDAEADLLDFESLLAGFRETLVFFFFFPVDLCGAANTEKNVGIEGIVVQLGTKCIFLICYNHTNAEL